MKVASTASLRSRHHTVIGLKIHQTNGAAIVKFNVVERMFLQWHLDAFTSIKWFTVFVPRMDDALIVIIIKMLTPTVVVVVIAILRVGVIIRIQPPEQMMFSTVRPDPSSALTIVLSTPIVIILLSWNSIVELNRKQTPTVQCCKE
jgi:hypothetical protein